MFLNCIKSFIKILQNGLFSKLKEVDFEYIKYFLTFGTHLGILVQFKVNKNIDFVLCFDWKGPFLGSTPIYSEYTLSIVLMCVA